MFPVNVQLVKLFMETMYLLLTAVETFWISACSNQRTLWKTWRLLSFTHLSFYEVTRVVLLGISRIPGYMVRTYRAGNSVAYFVLVIKIPRCT